MKIFDKLNLKNRALLGGLSLLAALLVSCSSGSSSSSDVYDETSSESSSESGKSSSSRLAEGSVTDADVLDVNDYDNSDETSVTDPTSDTKYSIVKLGIYMWLGEDVNKVTTDVKNTCYEYDESLCPKYKRFYMAENAESVCPEGFRLPSIYEWKQFLAEKKIKVLGGQCTKRDTLECFGLDSSARYLARYDSAVTIEADGSVSYSAASPREFYHLRCVKRKSIVSDLSDLPKCDKNSDYGTLFVGAEDVGYACRDGEWKQSLSRSCLPEEAKTLVAIHDSLLYACIDGDWTLASIQDVDEKCTSKNLEREILLNGKRYACTDTGWMLLKFPGSELGYCSESTFGKTAMALHDSIYYHCDSTGWRIASLNEILGTCDSTRYGRSKSSRGEKFVCRFGSWDRFSDVEEELGTCTAEHAGEAFIYEGNFYVCDTSRLAWRIDDALLHIGKCDSTRYFDTVVVGDVIYLCNDYNRWQKTSAKNGKYYLCTSKNLGKIKDIEGDNFICKKNSSNEYVFDYATSLELKFGYCPQADTSHVVSGDSVYYCYNGNWKYYGKYVPRDTVSKDTVVEDTVKKDTVRKYPIADIPECNYYTRDSVFFTGLTEYKCMVSNENYYWRLYSEDSVLDQKGYWVETITLGTQTWYCYTRDKFTWYIATRTDVSHYVPPVEPKCAEGFHIPSVADWKKLFNTMNANVPGGDALWYFANKPGIPRNFGLELYRVDAYWASDEVDASNARCVKVKESSYSFDTCRKGDHLFTICVSD